MKNVIVEGCAQYIRFPLYRVLLRKSKRALDFYHKHYQNWNNRPGEIPAKEWDWGVGLHHLDDWKAGCCTKFKSQQYTPSITFMNQNYKAMDQSDKQEYIGGHLESLNKYQI